MQIKTKKSSTSKAMFWAEHVHNWRESRLTKIDYCRNNGLSRHAFYYWIKKFQKQDQPDNKIVPIDLKLVETSANSCSIRLIIKHRFYLDISRDFDSGVLSRLIRTLENIR